MRRRQLPAGGVAAMAIGCLVLTAGSARGADTLAQRNEELLVRLQAEHRLDAGQMARVRAVFAESPVIGQGNPAITEHPETPRECLDNLRQRHIEYGNQEYARICGGPHMAPLYDPSTQTADQATVCIDQFEFPDIPCTYPVVWVRAREAALLCEAMGKRLCDAHEWEGACAGSLGPPEYRFDLAAGVDAETAVRRMRAAHNAIWDRRKVWSYGSSYRTGVCAAGSRKSPACQGGEWDTCGSNTYPSGSFPDCRSPLGVYDLNGNAAEHMNLPLDPGQMASGGSAELGYTEMKGSWFIFDSYRAHEDACRWRAPFWHGSRVMDPTSHRNYHLGFRCCKTIAAGGEVSGPGQDPGSPPPVSAPPED